MVLTTIREIGGGGFAKVYLVQEEGGQRFAKKVFSPQAHILAAAGEDHLKRRFKREVLYQQAIDHPNVIKIFDHALDTDPPHFVMELAECSLCDELQRDRTLSGDPRAALFDILSGLEALHDLGIVHRDLKPQNVLKVPAQCGGYRYAVSDFGLVSATQSQSTTLTGSNVSGGTPHYAAPELITDFRRGTHLSDVYSFGVILFDIFGGGAQRIPYTEINTVGGPVGQIIARCTKRVPVRRYPSVADLRADLYDALQCEDLVFSSAEEERLVQLLLSGNQLSEQEWDSVFILIDENLGNGNDNRNIFRAINHSHIQHLAEESPQLLASLGRDFCEFVYRNAFDFSYCDVLNNKLHWFFNCGQVELKAKCLLALLELGTRHNRWVVERLFMNLAGPDLPDNVANRVRIEIEIEGISFNRKIDHLEYSISTSRDRLHPILRAML